MLSGKSKRELTKLKLRPGAVVHIYCSHLTPPKNKFAVLTHIDEDDDLVLCFFINSKIHPFIKSKPEMRRCQVDIKKENYSFLKHNSYLDCSGVKEEFGYEELISHIEKSPKDYFGTLVNDDTLEILQIVQARNLISDADKDLIMLSLGH